MTNTEAIKLLSQIMDVLLASNSWLPSTHNPIKESFGMAINALTAQPETHEKRTETHSCDLISRKAAIDALKEHRNLFCDNTPDTFSKLSYAEKSRVDELDMAIATLINLPPAQPKMIREIRKWINSSNRGNADYFIVDKIEEIINKYE